MKKVAFVVFATTMIFALVGTAALTQKNKRVAAEIGKSKVKFTIGGKSAGTYIFKGVPKPIIYPIYAPSGETVTRDYPMGKAVKSKDHEHHQSVWFCHGDVIPKGIDVKQKIRGIKGVDFWSVHKGHGNIVCTSVKPGKSGENWASINTTNEWQTADGKKIMDEKRTVTLYNFGKARLWIFDIDLIATICAIIFGDTKEGSMAVRVHDMISERYGNGLIQNAKGQKHEKACWGRHAAWCDYSGTVDGKKVGIAIFDDPHNASPAAWHVRGYGLMGANPFGRKRSGFSAVKGNTKLVEIPKGGHLRLRYGVLVHDGGTDEANVAQYYQRFLQIKKMR